MGRYIAVIAALLAGLLPPFRCASPLLSATPSPWRSLSPFPVLSRFLGVVEGEVLGM
jgi:hypothetical protein